jgi:hypothetical protein
MRRHFLPGRRKNIFSSGKKAELSAFTYEGHKRISNDGLKINQFYGG